MKQQIIFRVVSESSGQEYQMIAEHTERGLRFNCNCAAGLNSQFCKHRQAIIDGKFPSNLESEVISTIKGFLSMSRIFAIQTSIATAEEKVKLAKKQVTMLKHELGRRLEEGTA